MNYADDTTFHACDLDLKSLLTRLEHDAALVIEWFELNGSRKIAPEENYPPSPNSSANPKPNPDPDRGAIFRTPN